MKQFALTALIVLAALCAGMNAAFALSQQAGNGVPGAFVNLADPDEQTPPFLRLPNGQTSSSASDNFDGGSGQGFVSKDVVQQSAARGSGSYLPPEPQQ